jgi:hypothetical protein
MTVAIQVLEFANGTHCPMAGQYIKTFDHEAGYGKGCGTFTTNIKQAMQFRDIREAIEFWRRTSVLRPKRNDGKPNRPLSCCTCTFHTIPE